MNTKDSVRSEPARPELPHNAYTLIMLGLSLAAFAASFTMTIWGVNTHSLGLVAGAPIVAVLAIGAGTSSHLGRLEEAFRRSIPDSAWSEK